MILVAALLALHPHPPVPDTPDAVRAYAEAELSAMLDLYGNRTDEQRAVIARLNEMTTIEQEGRDILSRIDAMNLDFEANRTLKSAVWAVLQPIDEANQAELEEYMDRYGWFPKSKWGDEAAGDAWLIAQHGSLDLQKRVLALMKPMLETGDADKSRYALMFDRVALREGRPQRYGSQVGCVDGAIGAQELEDPDDVDARRAEMNLEPLEEYLARFDFPCE